ncbi:hypothetical protein SYNTR_0938 [Candidatus Syntrophocurvum alkaliphilum]|uniref:DNA ligase n=1 Tax=Candidatus Syntrophocurvum alkaliphilum TaxID=2293317 RepID=A0A6I6DJ99_9FIRM|nr:DNA ligase [Candidatus Syntrophocurvum alkaliphilum]QGT99531.1 hypothetical protein SYNTR_0938 [Candidatus Syntrophocurvum alkaliphilum]
MSDLSQVVTELRNAVQSLNSAADLLTKFFNSSGGIQITSSQETEENPITLEAVRAVLADKALAGYTSEVRALLEKHGAEKLSEIYPAKYPALLKEAEVLGNG